MVIGIAGGTCSGKSSVATILAKRYNAKVISLDSYFKNPGTFPMVLEHPDYDRIGAIDWDKFLYDIENAKGSLVVEGFLILAVEQSRKLLDVSFFIDQDEDILIARRLIREPDTITGYIHGHVRQMHHELVLPSRQYADIMLDGSLPLSELAARIEQSVDLRLNTKQLR